MVCSKWISMKTLSRYANEPLKRLGQDLGTNHKDQEMYTILSLNLENYMG